MSEPMTGRSAQPAKPLEPLVPLEVFTSTAELAWRSCRAPQYEAESQVLVELAGQMIRSPAGILGASGQSGHKSVRAAPLA